MAGAGIAGQRAPEEVFRRYLKKLKESGVPEIVEFNRTAGFA